MCRRTRRVAAHLQGWSAWRQAIVSRLTLQEADSDIFSQMRTLVSKIIDDVVHVTGSYGRGKIEKRLLSLLEPSQKTRIPLHPLVASSYDSPEENLAYVVSPIVRTTKMLSYWSSSGSESAESSESVSFIVYPPCALIARISIRPFAAWFQRGRPIYPPQKVQFTIGGIPLYTKIDKLLMPASAVDMVRKDYGMDMEDPACHISLHTLMETSDALSHGVSYDTASSLTYESRKESVVPRNTENSPGWYADGMCFRTQQFTVEPLDTVQHFDLPIPALCINGYLKIDLIGKVTRQEADMKYYTCLGYVACEGYQLKGFFYNFENNEFQFEEGKHDIDDNEDACASDSDSEHFHNTTSVIARIQSLTPELEDELRAIFNL